MKKRFNLLITLASALITPIVLVSCGGVVRQKDKKPTEDKKTAEYSRGKAVENLNKVNASFSIADQANLCQIKTSWDSDNDIEKLKTLGLSIVNNKTEYKIEITKIEEIDENYVFSYKMIDTNKNKSETKSFKIISEKYIETAHLLEEIKILLSEFHDKYFLEYVSEKNNKGKVEKKLIKKEKPFLVLLQNSLKAIVGNKDFWIPTSARDILFKSQEGLNVIEKLRSLIWPESDEGPSMQIIFAKLSDDKPGEKALKKLLQKYFLEPHGSGHHLHYHPQKFVVDIWQNFGDNISTLTSSFITKPEGFGYDFTNSAFAKNTPLNDIELIRNGLIHSAFAVSLARFKKLTLPEMFVAFDEEEQAIEKLPTKPKLTFNYNPLIGNDLHDVKDTMSGVVGKLFVFAQVLRNSHQIFKTEFVQDFKDLKAKFQKDENVVEFADKFLAVAENIKVNFKGAKNVEKKYGFTHVAEKLEGHAEEMFKIASEAYNQYLKILENFKKLEKMWPIDKN